MKKTGLIFFPAFDWSISQTHPEREERLLYTRDQLLEEGFLDLDNIIEYKAELAEIKDILRVHFCIPDYKGLITNPHLIAAGSCKLLADEFMEGKIKNAFSLVRPPGHHAMQVTYDNRGFCNINNEAIMIEYLRKKYGIKKVAIIDSDVHHGDGTQDIFYNDPDVLFISFHQDGRTLFPGTGFMDEAGGVNAWGKTINIPMAPGTGDIGIHRIIDKAILPILNDFKPELIINSAGQDNHFTDPLANMRFTARGYGLLTEKLKPDIVVLEGGYAVESALPYVNMAVILALTGEDYSNVIEPELKQSLIFEKDEILDYTDNLIEKVNDLWEKSKNINKNSLFGKEKFITRRKSIFYDTNYLSENQIESVRRCNSCPGWIGIHSYLERGSYEGNSYCISIPLYACDECREEAILDYRNKCNDQNFDNVFLQDKKNDIYLLNGKEII